MTHVNEWSVTTSRGNLETVCQNRGLNSQQYVLVFTFSLSREHKTVFMSRPKITVCAYKSLFTWTISKEIHQSHEKMKLCTEILRSFASLLKYYISLNMNLWKGWREHTQKLCPGTLKAIPKSVISPRDFPFIHKLLILELGCCFQLGESKKYTFWNRDNFVMQ